MLFIDTETYSSEDIKNGAFKYFAADDAKTVLVSYAVNSLPVQLWMPGKGSMPKCLAAAIYDKRELVVAHNAQFDRLALKKTLRIDIPLERWRCTMAQAYSHGLPGGLAKLGEALGLPADKKKDAAGSYLIGLFCKPQGKHRTIVQPSERSHPLEWEEFKEYAKQDVEALREIYHRLPGWNYPRDPELTIWQLDQIANEYGIRLDSEFIQAVLAASDAHSDALDMKMHVATEGQVTSITQRDRLLNYIESNWPGALPNLRAPAVTKLVESGILPPELNFILTQRLLGAKSSVSKYTRAKSAMQNDSRIRGTLQYCGAGRTGRYAGRILQPQNMPRPTVKNDMIATYRKAFLEGSIHLITDDVMQAAADCVRSMIVAPPGKKLLVADYSNIEGRVLAWLAGEQWKLDAFRALDEGTGADLYCIAYGRAFGIDPDEVTGDMRQIGKTMELAFGYGGGVGAMVSTAEMFGLDLAQIVAEVLPKAPPQALREALNFWNWAGENGKRHDLDEQTFVALDVLKRLYRRDNPNIEALWGAADYAFRTGSGRIGEYCYADKFKAWLRFRLPSGRYLCYPGARIKPGNTLAFLGQHQITHQWGLIDTYGAKLIENITQAVARDVLVHHFPTVQRFVGQLLFSSHDEAVVEADADQQSIELADALTEPLSWFEGLPLSASHFECEYYQKH